MKKRSQLNIDNTNKKNVKGWEKLRVGKIRKKVREWLGLAKNLMWISNEVVKIRYRQHQYENMKGVGKSKKKVNKDNAKWIKSKNLDVEIQRFFFSRRSLIKNYKKRKEWDKYLYSIQTKDKNCKFADVL